MASTVTNGPGVPLLKRGVPANIGTLTAAASVVQFTLPDQNSGADGLEVLTVVTVGGTITPAMEGSIDGGNTWFGVPIRAAGLTITVTVLNSDTAVTSASSFEVSGLQAGTLFRFGSTAITGSPVVWALLP
jgi:hypothetical protein